MPPNAERTGERSGPGAQSSAVHRWGAIARQPAAPASPVGPASACAVAVVLALLLGNPPPATAQQSPTHSIQWDEDFSAEAGAENALTLLHFYGKAEERLWGRHLRGEDGRKAAKRGLRFASILMLDVPVVFSLAVGHHEVFGHGARARELGATEIEYHFALPLPYSTRRWRTRWRLPGASAAENALIQAGGMEATGRLAHRLALRSLRWRALGHHDALLYLLSFHDETWYFHRSLEDSIEDRATSIDDPVSYVESLAGYYRSREFEVNDLKDRSLVNLLDPLTLAAVCSVVRYFWHGDESLDLQRFSLGKANLMPGLRLGLAPYGPEYYLRLYFTREAAAGYAYARYGDLPHHQSLGLGFESSGFWHWDRFSLDLQVDAWQQPPLELRRTRAPEEEGLAGLLWMRFRLGERLWLTVGAGAKTEGYVPGLPLEDGPLLRVGLDFESSVD